LQSCHVLLLTNKRVGLLVEFARFSDLFVVHARCLEDKLGLKQQSVLAVEAGPREKDDPGNIAGMSGNQWPRSYRLRHGHQAGSLWVNLLAGFQVGKGGFGVAGKILGRRVRIVAGGLADSPFIERRTAMLFASGGPPAREKGDVQR